MKYLIMLVLSLAIGFIWYTQLEPKVYACSESGNPPDVVKQCKSITRWQSWVKK